MGNTNVGELIQLNVDLNKRLGKVTIENATYDLTNLATMKDWPLKITFIDLAWGTFLGTSTSTITYLLYNLIF